MKARQLNAVTLAFATGLASASAHAQDPGGVYAEAFGGASMLKDSDVTGNVVGKANFKSGPVVGAELLELQWAMTMPTARFAPSLSLSIAPEMPKRSLAEPRATLRPLLLW